MTTLIEKAVAFATDAHKGQFRKWGSKDPFISHPLRVFEAVAKLLPYNDDAQVAAILHDTVEDCEGITHKEICAEFGWEVSLLVWELTNPSIKKKELSRFMRKALDREHIGRASLEAQIIKACDRIDNLKSMDGALIDFKRLYGHESLLLADVLNKIPDYLFNDLVSEAESLLLNGQK
jgi:(p)ppGpp synthase/HD superfamily hydrolase